jgi:predicted RNase H-like HicB family nuclease
MNRLWYWVIIERHDRDRFVARLYDLPELVAEGASEDEAAANLKKTANEYVRQHVEVGELPPRASSITEIGRASVPLVSEFGRRLIAVDAPRPLAKPSAK